MRIVAGTYRGRRIEAPKGDSTRPTTDRVREALFSTLASLTAPDLGGGAALDAFAGSGALGLEALSRGCRHVTFIERDRTALTTLKSNIAALKVERVTTVHVADAFAAVHRAHFDARPFSLLLLDPPYRLVASEVVRLLEALAARDLLEEGCVIVWEHARDVDVSWPADFRPAVHKRYGTTEVDFVIYERGAGE